MAAYMPLVQQFLSAYTAQLGGSTVNISANATTASVAGATATPLTSALTMPTDLSSLLTFLLSFSALRDWMKLAVLGGFIEMCRRFVFGGYTKLVNSFFITACFEEQDASYGGSTGDDDGGERFKSSRKLAYLPSLLTTYNLWYKRRWMTITRVQSQTGWYGSKEQTLFVSIMTRDHTILGSLLQEARRDYLAAQVHKMCVYVSDTSNNWRHVACREKRSMHSIILDPGEWYAERGIPFRRGYLLYGAPGSGKTSFIHSVAGELGLDVYIICLSRIGLDDSSLGELVNALPERCVALMEDIDAAFTSGVNRDAVAATVESQENAEKPISAGFLNALDGVGAQEGRILFATTNKYSVLDAALCRPGRMDLHIEFKLASKFQARQLFSRFYLPAQNPDTMLADDDEDDEEEGSEKGSEDSGYSSTAGEDGEEKVVRPQVKSGSADVPEDEKPTYNGTSHQTRAPKLKRKQIGQLAVRFSQSIPEREISMASLQGFLMAYKTRPFQAVEDAGAWVEKERGEKVAKELKEKETEAEKAKAAALAKEKEVEKAKEAAVEKEKARCAEEKEKTDLLGKFWQAKQSGPL
ncbi:hypothetical protein C8F04DRAFT_1081926 [Mycena alexandri]|uniref:P-loop containing nucleoside triphosphate hydrolase protein n=1 Tax=Mycena alexandri TaxID=1745969 RepID=A0AAD6X8M6_9AGAR|nr:hypothetical protein C8F04DRAFT_1081926 [Mycena alexandri]